MCNTEKVSVDLTKEMSRLVLEAVGTGQYQSVGDVVQDALADWKDKKKQKAATVRHLRKLFEDGLKSGPSRFLSMEEIIVEANRRFDAMKKATA